MITPDPPLRMDQTVIVNNGFRPKNENYYVLLIDQENFGFESEQFNLFFLKIKL